MPNSKKITDETYAIAALIENARNAPLKTCLASNCIACPLIKEKRQCDFNVRVANHLVKNGVTLKKETKS